MEKKKELQIVDDEAGFAARVGIISEDPTSIDTKSGQLQEAILAWISSGGSEILEGKVAYALDNLVPMLVELINVSIYIEL